MIQVNPIKQEHFNASSIRIDVYFADNERNLADSHYSNMTIIVIGL